MKEKICNQQNLQDHNLANMKKTAIVVVITLLTMIVEIVYGLITGSMALLADGIHMGTHTFALIITLTAYLIAGRHAENPNFAFSTGKVGILGGYTNAIILGITAFYMVYEAIQRLINPENIIFNQALLVAVIGLTVNLISALLLSAGGHEHHHGQMPQEQEHGHHQRQDPHGQMSLGQEHGHPQRQDPLGHEHGHHQGQEHGEPKNNVKHTDHNLRSAYLHVITDALTSVLAIVALLFGKFFDQIWLDPVVAILGALVILKWAYGLLVSTGKLLVDYHPAADDDKIRAMADESGSIIRDLHIWKTSENHKAIILHLEAGKLFNKADFIKKIRNAYGFSHITLELE